MEKENIETMYTCALSGVLNDFTAKTALDELRRIARDLADRCEYAENRMETIISGFSNLVVQTAYGAPQSMTPEERRQSIFVLNGGKL